MFCYYYNKIRTLRNFETLRTKANDKTKVRAANHLHLGEGLSAERIETTEPWQEGHDESEAIPPLVQAVSVSVERKRDLVLLLVDHRRGSDVGAVCQFAR